MPSYTITVSSANATRILAALDAQFEWEDDPTNLQKYQRWLKGQHTELVVKNERRVAQGAISPDTGIADVT